MTEIQSLPPWQLIASVTAIAFLYASVGFGGASGYLAAMSLFSIPPDLMSTTALSLNILVSGIAFITYYRERHFAPRLLWPFLLTSIPGAFLGGTIQLEDDVFYLLLYGSLTYIAIRMLASSSDSREIEDLNMPRLGVAVLAGGAIGLLSGMIGIGGGIFLSPLIVLARWGTPKQAASSAAGFIFVNSVSGLLGRAVGGNFVLGPLGLALIPLGVLGAVGGSRLGAKVLSNVWMRRVLGIVLLIAVLRFWLTLIP